MNDEISKILENHERRISQLESLFQSKPENVKKNLSVKEFILSKSPTGDVQKTLVIGYYLEKYDGLLSFNVKDIENAFRAAKETVPDNINYKIFRNIEKGYMMESKEKKDNLKSFTLTSSGERFVENNLKEE
ncbi:MAG: hypothetical protein WCE94_13810 [Candidatus Methanoperedens sp.]